MTNSEKQKVLDFCLKFCNANINQRLNDWLAESFMNRLNKELSELISPNEKPKKL